MKKKKARVEPKTEAADHQRLTLPFSLSLTPKLEAATHLLKALRSCGMGRIGPISSSALMALECALVDVSSCWDEIEKQVAYATTINFAAKQKGREWTVVTERGDEGHSHTVTWSKP